MHKLRRKHSKKREAILKALQSTTVHPGAQWVYDQLHPVIPDLSLGTIYRNLNLFLVEGSAMSLGVINGEERFDGCIKPHPHCVCTNCGKIFDVMPPEEKTLQLIEDSGFLLEIRNVFQIDYLKTIFYGICSDCGRS